jgi:magnesium chelatase family protein
LNLARVHTVAFLGIEARTVEVEVQVSSGIVVFNIVGLPDKAVSEARERVRGALHALGLGLPAKRLTVNLVPADIPKEGSHYDLPIALGVLAVMDILPKEDLAHFSALGELSLDGRINHVSGVLPAALAAAAEGRGLICPQAAGPEAAWVGGDSPILAAPSLLALINHFKGLQLLPPPAPAIYTPEEGGPDLADVKGQESAKRVLEIAAAGGHNLLMIGPPGAGKSMLARRLPGLLPPLSAEEALEVSLVHSVAGQLPEGVITRTRPFRAPHHSASMAAMVGGGRTVKPGEVSLAHNGVLFLDELPEFERPVLDSLREPLETGEAMVARVNAHVRFPALVQLVAAMNPCRCGHLADPARACARAPRCAQEYQSKISGPLYDRIDLVIEVPAVLASDLSLPQSREDTAAVRARISTARELQRERYAQLAGTRILVNARAEGEAALRFLAPDDTGRQLLIKAMDAMKLSARGYTRILRVARTLADLEGSEVTKRAHIAEALAYRRPELAR